MLPEQSVTANTLFAHFTPPLTIESAWVAWKSNITWPSPHLTKLFKRSYVRAVPTLGGHGCSQRLRVVVLNLNYPEKLGQLSNEPQQKITTNKIKLSLN